MFSFVKIRKSVLIQDGSIETGGGKTETVGPPRYFQRRTFQRLATHSTGPNTNQTRGGRLLSNRIERMNSNLNQALVETNLLNGYHEWDLICWRTSKGKTYKGLIAP